MKQLSLDEVSAAGLRITPRGTFQTLTVEELLALEPMGVYMEYEQEIVANAGQQLGYLFQILQGTFEVSTVEKETGKKVLLAKIQDGECFGEMSFFNSSPATANVIAVGKVICWAIPHDSLRYFLENMAGGARLAMAISASLARRIEYSNSRVAGLNVNLSHRIQEAARLARARSNDPTVLAFTTECEIPVRVFEKFVRETLSLPRDAELGDEEREKVLKKLEKGQLDISAWLERSRFNVRMSIESGDSRLSIPDSEEDEKLLVKLRRRMDSETGPRARSGSSVLPQAKRWNWVHVSSYFILPVLTALAVLSWMPLESRELLVSSQGFQQLPFHNQLRGVLVQDNSQSANWNISRGASYTVKVNFPKSARLEGTLKLSEKLPAASKLLFKIISAEGAGETGKAVFSQIIDVPAQQEVIDMISLQLEQGTYFLECICQEWPEKIKVFGTVQFSSKS
jgi:CRP-like cAMP-binding protein